MSEARSKIWRHIRCGDVFTITSVSEATGVNRSTARSYIKALAKGGFLKVIPCDRHIEYVLINDTGVEPPRFDPTGKAVGIATGRKRLWDTMRRLTTFTPRDLSVTASLPDAPVSLDAADRYCGWLLKGGYLRITDGSMGAGKDTTYRFVWDTGPREPVIRRLIQVIDSNTAEPVYEKAMKS